MWENRLCVKVRVCVCEIISTRVNFLQETQQTVSNEATSEMGIFSLTYLQSDYFIVADMAQG